LLNFCPCSLLRILFSLARINQAFGEIKLRPDLRSGGLHKFFHIRRLLAVRFGNEKSGAPASQLAGVERRLSRPVNAVSPVDFSNREEMAVV
jgi:hypothetical protein